MRSHLLVLATLIVATLISYPLLSLAGDIDPTAFLTQKLSSKQLLKYQHCHGPTRTPDCNIVIAAQQINQTPDILPAAVTDAHVVEVGTLVFDMSKVTSLPESMLIDRKPVINCANINATQSVQLTVAGTKSWSVSKENGISTTLGASLSGSLQIPLGSLSPTQTPVGSLSSTLSWSQTISSSTAQTEGHSDTATVSLTDTVQVNPKQVISTELIAYQEQVDVPYHAEVVVDGNLLPNLSGLTRASDLLSTQERTLVVNGVLHVADVSEGFFKTSDLSFDQYCGQGAPMAAGSAGKISMPSDIAPSSTSRAIRATDLKGALVSKHVWKTLDVGLDAATSAAGIPTIGPPDGTSYHVISTTVISKPGPECGFNDAGIPIMATYSVEQRQYETYSGGKLVSEWTESAETFINCTSP